MAKFKKYLAFLYNIRHNYPDPDDPRTFLEADFDDPETITSFIKHLKVCGYRVLPIEANIKSWEELDRNKGDIFMAFNYSEIVLGEKEGVQITRYLEDLKIPFTGPDDASQVLIRNKIRAKEILRENGIPVLPHQVFKTGDEPFDEQMKFPLIVKPSNQGSSAGITNKSVVENVSDLYKQVKEILARFNDEVLVEPFLEGREFSIPLVGSKPDILPIIEPDFSNLPKDYKKLDSYEVKWIYEEGNAGKDHLICPAEIDEDFRQKLENIALDVWNALNIKDFCRIDIRCDNNLKPYVLEINSPAGLIPPEVSQSSYLPLSARKAGISFPELLKKIVDSALERYKILV